MPETFNDSITKISVDRALFIKEALEEQGGEKEVRTFSGGFLSLYILGAAAVVVPVGFLAPWPVTVLTVVGMLLVFLEARPLFWATHLVPAGDPTRIRALRTWSDTGFFPQDYQDPAGDFEWGDRMRNKDRELNYRMHLLELRSTTHMRAVLGRLDTRRAADLIAEAPPVSAHDRHIEGIKRADQRDIDAMLKSIAVNYDGE